MTTTTTDRAAATAYHAQQTTNGIATVAGHLARLRELTTDPAQDATYRQLLANLGEISMTVRKLHDTAFAGKAA